MKFRSFVAAAFGVALLAGITACAPEPPPPPPDAWDTAVGECWASFNSAPDLAYFGPKNTKNNAGYYFGSSNGTCSGSPFLNTIVQAADVTEARVACQGISAQTPAPLSNAWVGPTIPDDAWICIP